MTFLNKIKEEKFKYFLIAVLSAVFIFLIPKNKSLENVKLDTRDFEKRAVHIFVQKGCSHCVKIEKFIPKIKDNYPNIRFEFHDLTFNRSKKL
jgi:hypothetical protein